FIFLSSRRRHTRSKRDWSSDVCSSDLIGHDQEITIKELFQVICKTLHKHPKAYLDTSKPDGYLRRAADVSLLKKITGFVPAISRSEERRVGKECRDREWRDQCTFESRR